MTDKAVSALTSLTGASTATGDLLYIVDISEAAAADRSKKITAQEIQNYLKTFPATIGVGGATPAASGAGVSFPATASASSDANTLDDYEEGSWTPIAVSELGSITTYSSSGTYIKIGRVVHIQFRVNLTTVGTASGLLRITNTNFAFPGSTNDQPGGVVRESATTGNNFFAFGIGGSNEFRIQTSSANGITYTNGYAYTGCLTYYVD